VTSATATGDDRHGYRRQLFALLGEHVLPQFAGRAGAPATGR
jgi:hypothetical protein